MKNTINDKNIKEVIDINATPEDKGKRLDAFLQECIEGATKNYIQKLIDNENVLIKNIVASKCGIKIKGNEDIIINVPEDESIEAIPEDIPLEKIYEDEDIVIINKGPDMVVHPAHGNYKGTLVNALMFHIKDLSSINGVIRPGIVHRLDKDTSGIIIVAKNDKAHIKLSEMFKEKELEKTYICICKGNFKEKQGRIENLIDRHPKDRKKMAVVEEGGRIAISNYEVLQEVKGFSLVKVRIETGRTHQIRVHMRFLNHPILGDSTYGNTGEKDIAKRQMLHAYNLKFNQPVTGVELDIFAPLPQDMRDAAKKIGFDLDAVFEKKEKLKIKIKEL